MEKLIMLPGPTNVSKRVMNAMTKPIINHRGEEFKNLYRGIVEKTRRLFQTNNSVVILSCSGTGGVEACVSSCISKGDLIIVPSFGEFSERLAETAEIYGAQVVRVIAENGNAPSLEEVKEAIDNKRDAKSILLVHNETSMGIALPYIEDIIRYAKNRNMTVLVDAISSLGGYNIPVENWKIDFCITGSQKCIAAPPGLALVSLSEQALEIIRKRKPVNRYFDLLRYLDYQERGQTPFTPALPLFYALDEALNEIFEEGLSARIERHEKMSRSFYSSFETIGLKFLAKKEYRSRTVIALLYPEGIEDKKFRARLEQEYGVVIAGGFGSLSGKVFRVGCMGLVNQDYVSKTVNSISSNLSFFKRD